MSKHPPSRRQRGFLPVAALCMALALSGCGGSSSNGDDTAPPPPSGGTPPPVATDSFFAYVMARVGSLLDNEEPEAIDAVAETRPENTEPEPVG